ncbi:hypothetical protein [Demequina aurantiaca]|uniref:hypothetical protein n=1 Tax=Demequina aurantiaca TaxID=676200 RepID=UPI0007839936|nr:hypothetical protein [Demequina aurantiaca]
MNETQRASEYVGIYDADGGVRGELTYVVGHLIGTKHCALCDITHSPIRRKPEWKAMVARLGVPFRLLHRNEMPADIAAAVAGRELAIVLAKVDGRWVEALSSQQLEAVHGDVPALEAALRASVSPAG